MGPLFDAILGGQNPGPLLQRGISPNIYAEFPGVSWTPLHLAVYHNLPQVAELLLQAGASPNAPGLPSSQDGPYRAMVGMTPVDLAVTLDCPELVALLVQKGGRPGCQPLPQGSRARQTLHYELARARVVGVAESLVVEAILRPLVEQAQEQRHWDEADRLLRRLLSHEAESEHTLHLGIRGLLARGLVEQAMEEASLVFVSYRRQGRYLEALQVARSMRSIDPASSRPYELELEFLAELGWMEQARRCLERLLEVHRRAGRSSEIEPSRVRFAILCRRPKRRTQARHPGAWTAPEMMSAGSSSNLPALLDEEQSQAPGWWDRLRRLWWGLRRDD